MASMDSRASSTSHRGFGFIASSQTAKPRGRSTDVKTAKALSPSQRPVSSTPVPVTSNEMEAKGPLASLFSESVAEETVVAQTVIEVPVVVNSVETVLNDKTADEDVSA